MKPGENALFLRKSDPSERLSRQEEQELARRYIGGDVAAAHRLILSHLRFVHHVARRYGRDGHALSDLVQEGTVGLIEAVRRFNPDRGVRLSTYAMWWIRASIQDHIVRSRSLVKIGTTAAQKAMFLNLRRRMGAFADLETVSDDITKVVADRFSTSVEEVRRFARRIARPDQSLDAPVSAESNDSWVDYLPDTRPSPEDRLSRLRDFAGGVLVSRQGAGQPAAARTADHPPPVLRRAGAEPRRPRGRARAVEGARPPAGSARARTA